VSAGRRRRSIIGCLLILPGGGEAVLAVDEFAGLLHSDLGYLAEHARRPLKLRQHGAYLRLSLVKWGAVTLNTMLLLLLLRALLLRLLLLSTGRRILYYYLYYYYA
jgi:hypothetical protein